MREKTMKETIMKKRFNVTITLLVCAMVIILFAENALATEKKKVYIYTEENAVLAFLGRNHMLLLVKTIPILTIT